MKAQLAAALGEVDQVPGGRDEPGGVVDHEAREPAEPEPLV